MKLTSKTISRFSPPAGKLDHIEFDDDLRGFGLRIRNGKASFVYQYAFGTAPNRVNRRITLGSFPGLPAEKARNLITLFAETLGAQDRCRHKLIASVLDDLDRLSRTAVAPPDA